MTHVQMALIALLVFVLYAYIRVRVASFLQPVRLEMVDKAARLLAYTDLDPDDRRNINAMLDMVFSVRAAWMLAILIFPASIRSKIKQLTKTKQNATKHRPHGKEIREFIRLGLPCILGSSPLATAIFFFMAALSYLAMLPVRSSLSVLLAMISRGDNDENTNGHAHRAC